MLSVNVNRSGPADGFSNERRARTAAIAVCVALMVIGLLWPIRVFADEQPQPVFVDDGAQGDAGVADGQGELVDGETEVAEAAQAAPGIESEPARMDLGTYEAERARLEQARDAGLLTGDEYEAEVRALRLRFLQGSEGLVSESERALAAAVERRAQLEQLLCEGETCSGHGACVVEDKVPVCKCEPGYARGEGGRSCEAGGGAAKAAGVLGVAGSIIVGGLSVGISIGATQDDFFLYMLGPILLTNATTFGVMVPAMSNPELAQPGVDGAPVARGLGWAMFVASMSFGTVAAHPAFIELTEDLSEDFPATTAIWSGLATLSIVCFTVDAWITYREVAQLADGATAAAARRPAVKLEPLVAPIATERGIGGGIAGIGGRF